MQVLRIFVAITSGYLFDADSVFTAFLNAHLSELIFEQRRNTQMPSHAVKQCITHCAELGRTTGYIFHSVPFVLLFRAARLARENLFQENYALAVAASITRASDLSMRTPGSGMVTQRMVLALASAPRNVLYILGKTTVH